MTANAAAVPGLVISATTEYLTNNYNTQTALEVYGRSTRRSKHTYTARTVEKVLIETMIAKTYNKLETHNMNWSKYKSD